MTLTLSRSSHAPLLLPHPATRPSREEVNSAIEAGLSPIIVQGEEMVMLGKPTPLPTLIGDFRYALRTRIAGVDWNEACARAWLDPANLEQHKGNLLIWGYRALCAERDASAEFVAMAADFHEARKATSEVAAAFKRDGRIMDGVPLPVTIKATIEYCDRHGSTFRTAVQQRKAQAADLLREWCGQHCAWMQTNGALVGQADGKVSEYHLHRMSLADLARLETVFAVAAELAAGIEKHGISGVIRQQRQGTRGRPPSMLEAWLVQQGRREPAKIGPQKLARLLAKHGLADAPLELMTRRLNESAAAHRKPVPLMRD